MIDTDIKLKWHLDSLPAGTVDPLLGFFDRLPVDPYIQGTFRERRYGRVEKEGSRFFPLDNGVFFQAAALNKILGGVPRTEGRSCTTPKRSHSRPGVATGGGA